MSAFRSEAEDVSRSCAVLVPSWDGYSDLWQPFFSLFWRHWPDCPFDVYLGANQRAFEDPRVRIVRAQAGTGWSREVREQLEAIPHSYVLMSLEDFFWRKPTRTERILECLRGLQELDGHMMRLTNRPPPDFRIAEHPLFGGIAVGAAYRVSTQATIWRRATLLELLRDGESIWEFETKGSGRSEAFRTGFYSTWEQITPYGYHVVERGKWFRHEAKRFARMGIGCDFSARPVMSRSEMARWRLRLVKGAVLRHIPRPAQRQLRQIARVIARRSQSV